MVGIDQGPEHVMTVWNWETEEESGKLLGKVATHQASVNIVQKKPLYVDRLKVITLTGHFYLVLELDT